MGCQQTKKAENVRQGKKSLAERPPMGWNSWICFGTSVTEDEVKANADFMAENLNGSGWEYIIIDAGWYAPGMVTLEQYEAKNPPQLIDEYGRLIVDTEKYPSAKNGQGLKGIADYVHSKGLKIGIHLMRGIPVQAVEQNTPVKKTNYRARDIANLDSQCEWYFGFYGIDMSKPGAQEYYDSMFELYESWGIDYVKVDDLLSPIYAYDEIEAIRKAMDKIKRPIVLSLSPGPAPVENINHLQHTAELWRISEDFWDNWESLKEQFPLCRKWQGYIGNGHWPDADMLPIGPMAQRAMRGKPRPTNFTEDEQYTMMTLWSMFRSPMMLGCNLPEMDKFTLSLVTNNDVLKINQSSKNNRELFERDGIICWFAQSKDDSAYYIALFNLNDEPAKDYVFSLQEINHIGDFMIKDLWNGNNVPVHNNAVKLSINAHGVRLIEIKNKN
ncbi:glycoside hydrolase family 27 protein [Paludibacter sp. 221]|nr:glycoside hydrolase family 27 protein [Paludibacter sp. 221]